MGNIRNKMRFKKKVQSDIIEVAEITEKLFDFVKECDEDRQVWNALIPQLNKNSTPAKKDWELDNSGKEALNDEEITFEDERSNIKVVLNTTETIKSDTEALDKENVREYFDEDVKIAKKIAENGTVECRSVKNSRTHYFEEPTGYGRIRTLGQSDTIIGYWREINEQTKTMMHTNVKFCFSGTKRLSDQEKIEITVAYALNLKVEEVSRHPLTEMAKKVRRESIRYDANEGEEVNNDEDDSIKQNCDKDEKSELELNKSSDSHSQDDDFELTYSLGDAEKYVPDRYGDTGMYSSDYLDHQGNIGQYVGGFANRLPHGKGKITYTSGMQSGYTYWGNWVYGMKDGNGRLWNNDMTIMFDGKWINDDKAKGTVTYWEGSQVYTGDIVFVNGYIIRNGSGILIYPSGKTISGFWIKGHLVGRFCCVDENEELSEHVFVPIEESDPRMPRRYSLTCDQYLDRFTSCKTSAYEQNLIKSHDLLFDLDACFQKERDQASTLLEDI